MNEEKVKILIVDDRQENLLAMTSVLQSTEYEIVTACSGEEALREVLKDEFAVIFMDVQMPGMNGFDTAQLIKSRDKSKSIPIIFVTALGHASEHIVKGYEAGAIDFLFKPVLPSSLKHKAEEFVRIFQERKQLSVQKELITRRTVELESANRKLVAATKELERMEALSRVIGETAADSFITLDGTGHIVAMNPAGTKMFACEEEALVGQPISLLFEDAEGWFRGESPLWKRPSVIECQGIRCDGSEFPAEVQFGSAQIEGQMIGVISVRDITERKQHYMRLEHAVKQRTQELECAKDQLEDEVQERRRISEELRVSNEQMNDVLESIPDSFFSLDRNWNVLYMNTSAEQQIGVSREKLLNKCLWDYVPKGFNRAYDMLQSVMLRRAPEKREFYSLMKEGYVEMKAFPSQQGIIIYIADTTELHQMQRNVRHSQERFYKIFKASPSLMAIQSVKDLTYVDVNESWLRYTGFSYQQIADGEADLKITLIGGEQGNEQSIWSLDKQADNVITDLKVCYETAGGETRIGLLSTEIIELDEMPCVLIVMTDITDRMELEHELQRLDRLHMIGEMAAGIAHEIRNPMTTVRGFLQLMRSRGSAPPDSILDVMVDELNRANSIITEFLALAKNKWNDLKRQSLSEVVEAIGPLIEAEATLLGKSVELNMEPGLEVDLDEKEIRQMVLNLTLNGLEAMEEGGALRIGVYSEGAEAVLEVRDQGTGIPREAAEKLGTPFFTTKDKGTGLGLAVCFSIAERHRAKITWDTSPAGTTFYVRFPLGSSAQLLAESALEDNAIPAAAPAHPPYEENKEDRIELSSPLDDRAFEAVRTQ